MDNLISIHPPRAGWDDFIREAGMYCVISIHPPRAGWDQRQVQHRLLRTDFNPPTPCGVGLSNQKAQAVTETFQSTHPVRGGTWY